MISEKTFADLDFRSSLYKGFPNWHLNNAMMLSYRTYHEKSDTFEKVHQLAGSDLRETVKILKRCEKYSDPVAYLEGLLSDEGK